MPQTLTLTYRPPLRLSASRVPTWRRIVALADAAVSRFAALWRGIWRDVRQRLRQRDLAAALGVHLLEGRSLIAQVWEQAVESPARRLLTALAHDVVEEAGETAAAGLSQLAGIAIPFVAGLPPTQQAIAQYVGTQIRDMTQTSLRAVQQTFREDEQAGVAAAGMARHVRQMIGLTAVQQRTLRRLQERWQEEGKSTREIARLRQQMVQQALEHRAQTAAVTQAHALANMAAHDALTQAVARGALDVERVRRFWVVVPGACVEHCQPIPGLNREGVGLEEAFQTPDGPALYPPRHPNCKCAVTVRLRER